MNPLKQTWTWWRLASFGAVVASASFICLVIGLWLTARSTTNFNLEHHPAPVWLIIPGTITFGALVATSLVIFVLGEVLKDSSQCDTVEVKHLIGAGVTALLVLVTVWIPARLLPSWPLWICATFVALWRLRAFIESPYGKGLRFLTLWRYKEPPT